MNRIAAGLLIAGAVLAMNTMMLRDAMAEQPMMSTAKVEVVRSGEVRETVETRGTRVLALVVALRALSAAKG